MMPEDGTHRAGARVQASYIDPYGSLFYEDDRYVRHVTAEAAAWFRPLHEEGVLARWSRENNLIACEPVEDFAGEEQGGWTVAHPAIRPLTVPAEWCGSMAKDAALATLDLLLAVNERGFTLQDAYPHNIVFEGCRPVFVDLTSIRPVEEHRIWTAYGQFRNFFWTVLLLFADGKGAMARRMLLDTVNGAPLEAVYPLLSGRARLRRPGLALGYWSERFVARHSGLRSRLKDLAAGSERRVEPGVRARFLRRLRSRTAAIRLPLHAGDNWSDYYTEVDEGPAGAEKMRTVEQVLQAERPRTVVDIGCNTGRFSLMAAAAGATVLAIDGSEACIERLYARAGAEHAAVTPIVADIAAPTPGHGFLSEEFSPLVERAASEAVLCLGLVHHLLVAGRQTEARVAALIRRLASKLAIVELVDPEDANVARINSARAVTYTSERMADALRARFRSVEILPSDRPTRRIAVCRL